MLKHKLLSWLPQLSHQVWILAAGRLLSQVGSGFTLFYAPIFFVNQVGLSATAVGIALGSASVSGVLGRFLGGSFADSRFWGRRRTLLLSAAVSALADVVLALTYNFPTLVMGNLLMGLGIGLYWPATEAAVADLTTIDQRNEAFAITRLADSMGLGIGVVLGGALIATAGNYRALFVIDGISFVVFFAIIYFAIAETLQFQDHQRRFHQSWGVAFSDHRLMVYVLVNILFTTYIAQVQSTMPLYFTNFVSAAESDGGFSPTTISGLFSWHIVVAVLCQLPVARSLNRFSRPHALMVSLLLWGGGFVMVWLTGVASSYPLIWAILALGILAIALVSYTPSSSTLVVDLAPESLRGVYLSINSQCWAIGYLIGPPMGGWALDQSRVVAHSFWLIAAASIGIGIVILQYLNQILVTQEKG
ncbi:MULTISPECIES: MFS transporter [unclassified Coleofasciculus]|uniref:MFS transporter n=1 Tax=unclassified Coleofasciculus TaxID=2692782 RepID=UPI0018814AA3|nr:MULTISPECIES: MFS transporter [unclassified Coleofasciculus]MBE9126581.1 MFS transporter [Coleofasciculus sp. LEGE 07081]MBE9149938.1 MFS transporter [Coleofasciculus sp. LEGE 07092]